MNTHPIPGGKDLVAMTEAVSGTYKVDVGSLSTKERVAYNDDLPGDQTTAHPVIYPDGSVYNIFLTVSRSATLSRLIV